MSDAAKLCCGILLITVPTIAFGGTFLLRILSGGFNGRFNDLQRSLFRAGHAHAGVLVILALVAQPLIDQARPLSAFAWPLRAGFMLPPILISGGFFGAAAGKDRVGPLIALVRIGAVVLSLCLLALGVGLMSALG